MVHAAWDPEIEEQEAPLSRLEQDEVQAAPHRHAELMQREEASCFRQFVRLGNFLMKFQNHAAKRGENEGPSGYVDENTGWEQTGPMTDCPDPVANRAEGTQQTDGDSGSEAQSPGSLAGPPRKVRHLSLHKKSKVQGPKREVHGPSVVLFAGHARPVAGTPGP